MFGSYDQKVPQQQRIREIEKLRFRSELLNSKDKTLMQMIFEKGSTFEQIARLTGQNPSTISRHFNTLLKKLITKEPAFLVHGRCRTDGTDVRIARDYFLHGLTQKAISKKYNISLYRVKTFLRAIRSMAHDCDATAADPLHKSRQQHHQQKSKHFL